MKIIRWWGVVAFIVVVGLIAGFNLLFLDGIIKRFIEERASLAAGARVDIGSLELKIFELSLDIRDLQVANPDQPMRNSLQVGRLTFDLGAAPLVKKKVVIDRMNVVGLSWDTPRKTSGALPARLRKKLEEKKTEQTTAEMGQAAQRRLEECVLPDFSALKELPKQSPEKLLAGADLKSVAFAVDYRKKIAEMRTAWEKKLAALPTKEEVGKNLKELQDLKDQRPRDFTQLPAYLEKINTLQKKIRDTQQTLTSTQEDLQKDMNGLRSSLADVEKLKEMDIKAVMGKLGVHIPSAEDLVCVLLGRQTARRVTGAIAWYRKLSRFIPAGKKKEEKPKPEPVPRMVGVDVRFPITAGDPDFLLRRAEFSAQPGPAAGEEKFRFAKLAGEIRGLTTQPALYGKPMEFDLQGSLAGQIASTISLKGQLDHRREPVDDQIHLAIAGLKVEGSQALSPAAPIRLTSALLDGDGDLRARGENLEGRVRIAVSQPKVEVGSSAAVLAGLFQNLGSFDVVLSIGGTLNQPSLRLSSSAVPTLSSGLQRIVGSELKGVQEDIQKAIASRLGPEMGTTNQELSALEKWVQEELSSRLKGMGK
jgi:uncharacterized protein (TIGR03545 family)